MFRSRVFLSAIFLVAITVLFSAACTTKEEGMSPKEVLETYVRVALNAKSEKDKTSLEVYLTGKALAGLKMMTQKDFREKLVKPEFKFMRFLARDQRQEENGNISLVYELTFENKSNGNKAKLVNRKIAYFKQTDDSAWKIYETRNMKSFIEMEKALDVMNFKYP